MVMVTRTTSYPCALSWTVPVIGLLSLVLISPADCGNALTSSSSKRTVSALVTTASDEQVWGGDCGRPPLPVKRLISLWERDKGHKVLTDTFPTDLSQDDTASSMPWLIRVWFPPLPPHGSAQGYYEGAATLVRARADRQRSDIAMTSADTCTAIETVRQAGHQVMAVFGVHGQNHAGYLRVPIGRCVPHERHGEAAEWTEEVFSHNIGVMKLGTAVTFTNFIRPACMPYASEIVAIGTPGITADWDIHNLVKILLKAVDSSRCGVVSSDTSICLDGYNSTTRGYGKSAIGGPFLTLRQNTTQFVLSGIVTLSEENLNRGTTNLPNGVPRVLYYVQDGWIKKKIIGISDLWR